MSKFYIVTGTSRGLGLEFVKQLSERGDTVFACVRNPASAKELQTLADNNELVYIIQLDTDSEESIKAAARDIASKAPEGVDILINNAGINGTVSVNLETTPKEDYSKIFQTNVVGVAEVTKAFLPILRKRGQDKQKIIVNISSILGSISLATTSDGFGFGVAYGVSKAGLNMLTKQLANQLLEENFIVYASHPGWVKTDLGTDAAPVEKYDSIAGQLAKLDNITREDNAGYFDFEGKSLGW